MNIKEIKELAHYAATKTAPENFSLDTVDRAFSAELSNLIDGSLNNYNRYKYDIFDIIIENADEIVPNKVIEALGLFAEIKTVPQNQKAIFKITKGKTRAKKFLTQVGLSGVYETFRLDKDSFEIGGVAVGGAATIDFERMLDGAEVLSDVMDIITEGLVEAVYVEVQKALHASLNAIGRPTANRVIDSSFVPDNMVRLVNIVRAYGSDAVIFAPPEFVSAMGADAIVVGGANYQGVYSPEDIKSIHETGYIRIFRGTPVVQLPQSFVDEDNNLTWIDPQTAYIMPTGRQKVVKVVLEGKTQVWDFINKDQSIEIHAYKKIGVGIITHHNWCIYQNTGITQTWDPDLV